MKWRTITELTNEEVKELMDVSIKNKGISNIKRNKRHQEISLVLTTMCFDGKEEFPVEDEVFISEDGIHIHDFEPTAKELKLFYQKLFALWVCHWGINNPFLK